jgi:small subunit ribosomal protein S17
VQKKLKTRLGRVESNAMDKTVVVVVERGVRHPLYKKIMRRRRKYKAHDEANACQVGDVVRMVESRPLSKEKRWRVVEIVTREKAVGVEPKEIGDGLPGEET